MSRRDAFLSDVLRSRKIGDPCRVLLVAMTTLAEVDRECRRGCYPMTDDGMVRICRDELAAALGGITPTTVSNRIKEAVKAGFLTRESGGRNGQVAGYQAHPPSMATGHRRNGPESLSALLAATLGDRENVVVGSTPIQPGTGSEALVGSTGIPPYARAHYSTTTANPETTTAESRVFLFGTEVVLAGSPGTGERPTGEVIPADGRDLRDDDVTGKGGTNGDEWISAPSRRPSSRRADGKAA